jgi:hypothetical protein
MSVAPCRESPGGVQLRWALVVVGKVPLVIRPRFSVSARLALLLAAVALLGGCRLLAAAPAEARGVHFDGKAVQVPHGWPVFRLSEHPGMCVRLDRRAVYLGTPSPNQSCPAEAIGRRRAILVEPRATADARAAVSSLPRANQVATASDSLFTGLGFDACSVPSARTMSAWGKSPYRAVGIYIGGINRACTQPNLTSGWVAGQTEAGWSLIPTYVGRQAPFSACSSCAKISPSEATAQGIASAVDAVADASAVSIGPGNPIYFDMEAYSRTSSATSATLAFLEAWTKKLHVLGYLSGVYSSTGSGIADLGDEVGTGYVLPDYLWFANWNNSKTLTDPVIPSTGWTSHKRIHQYAGGHNETYGGMTINIDNDAVDAGTVGSASSAGTDDPVGNLELTGAAHPGEVRVRGWAFDPNVPTQAVGIRVFVGGRAGAAGAAEYELGPVANLPRPVVGGAYSASAGKNHGFDLTFPVLKSGPQAVCAYALNVNEGADRLLGCKSTPIKVAVAITHLHKTAAGVSVRLSCEWPEGLECPGQLLLRTQVEVRAHHRRGTPPRYRTVTRGIGSRHFMLTGKKSHAFFVPLSAGGRALLRAHGDLKTQLTLAVPDGGRRVATFRLFR